MSDLEEIGAFIAQDHPERARRWVLRLIEAAEKASLAPKAGRRVPELGRDDVREVLLGNYRIVYRVLSERCEVLIVFEGHRLFPKDVPGGGESGP